MKNRIVLTMCFVIAMLASGLSQDYKTAVGGKLGYGLVASYKKFFSEKTGIDFFGGIHWGGSFMGGVNYSLHKNIKDIENLRWYYGAGANFFSWSTVNGATSWLEVGVSGNIGLEYTFEDIPLVLSVDYVPTVVVFYTDKINAERFRGSYGALTARYILSR